MNGLVIVANGMDYRNDWISLPNMIQSFLKLMVQKTKIFVKNMVFKVFLN